jgi:hypothetical protein
VIQAATLSNQGHRSSSVIGCPDAHDAQDGLVLFIVVRHAGLRFSGG